MGPMRTLLKSYVIRRGHEKSMWLTREALIVWGERERAIRYRSKGDAARAIARLRLGAATIEPA